MRDRTRRFTVGLGTENGGRHIRIFASDEKTKAWAGRNTALVTVVVTTLEREATPRKLGSEPLPWEKVPEGGIETPGTLAKRFEALMEQGFPDESFDIRPEVQ